MRVRVRRLAWFMLLLGLLPAALAPGVGAAAAAPSRPALRAVPLTGNQTYSVVYRAWNGHFRSAVVVLPKDYLPGTDQALPCVIQPHARHTTPAFTATIWQDLPTSEHFIVICPDSAGRVNPVNAWGAPGQVQDIMDMPGVIEATIPWVHIDRERLYIAGVSMGAQEALDALARFPDRFAAGAVFDGVSDLAARYRELAAVGRLADQKSLRKEVGGIPARIPFQYNIRGTKPFARTLADCNVPLAIWWSTADELVINGAKTQTGALCNQIRAVNPLAPLTETVTAAAHGVTLRQDPHLALDVFRPSGVWRRRATIKPQTWSYGSWLNDVTVWDATFSAVGRVTKIWRASVWPGTAMMSSPVPITMTIPWAGPSVIALNGVPLELTPQDGRVAIPFPAGNSVATWARD